MVVVGDDGEPMDDWRAQLARTLAEQLAPIFAATTAPLVDRVVEQLSPVMTIADERITEALAPLLESVTAQWSDTLLSPDFLALLEQVRRELPDNWPEDVDLDDVTEVIQDDGIPLVWVPPAAVVEEILEASDREARVDVLLTHIDDLIPDCRRVLADVHTTRPARQLPLAPRALDALEAGHYEAAQALAVVIIDATMVGWITGAFEAVQETVHFDPEELPYDLIRLHAAVAPLRNFKQRYFIDKTPRPPGLNRQVTVHYAEAEHFTRGNALVACLLMTSVLRALQDFEDMHAEDPQAGEQQA